MVTSMFLFPALGTRHKARQRTRLQLKQATYLAEVRAQREWERGGAGLDGEGVQTWKPGAKVHVGSRARRGHGSKGLRWPALQQRTPGAPPSQVRTSQSRHPSLQGSIYQVSIFLPVYW